ncbi:ABC-three component system middle component 6 [Heyndrickxia vini]|uniref:Uncharacterized protein n=1 Tax=Heyndrickxia vini TaxID=1476025 RepID=A0ABX7E2W2_9BACI|nr:ABC-three component system middle component 6 [Heyndrickxia vini]QQZ09619.1 hypothetical protein I5776_01110 [Heyndrickxia vini]
MIFPNKYIKLNNTLLGIAALTLSLLIEPMNMNLLWGKISNKRKDLTFDQFVLALDLLFVLGLIHFSENRIEKLILIKEKEQNDKKKVSVIIDFINYCEIRKLNKKDALIPYILEICEVLKNDTA